jgi:hypothetical protein
MKQGREVDHGGWKFQNTTADKASVTFSVSSRVSPSRFDADQDRQDLYPNGIHILLEKCM